MLAWHNEVKESQESLNHFQKEYDYTRVDWTRPRWFKIADYIFSLIVYSAVLLGAGYATEVVCRHVFK